jgi:hypothetical protein
VVCLWDKSPDGDANSLDAVSISAERQSERTGAKGGQVKSNWKASGRLLLHALFGFFISSRNRELIAVVLASVTLALVICQPMIVVIIRHWLGR